MKILGVIPARFASTRLPGKVLADICGKPIIQWVYERSLLAKVLDELIVATDDEKVYKAVENFGGKAVMTHKSHPNGTSRAAQAAKLKDVDIVVNIQGDEPLIDPKMIDEVVNLLLENPKDVSSTLVRPVAPEDFDNPGIVKTVCDRNGYAIYFSRSLIPYPRAEFHVPVYEHIGIFAYTKDFLIKYASLPTTPLAETESLEQLRVIEHGYKMRVGVTRCKNAGFCVDTPEDLEKMRKYFADAGLRL